MEHEAERLRNDKVALPIRNVLLRFNAVRTPVYKEVYLEQNQ